MSESKFFLNTQFYRDDLDTMIISIGFRQQEPVYKVLSQQKWFDFFFLQT